MKKELSDLMTLMNEALNRAEQEAAPSLEATVLEASAALPQETEILVKAIQEGDESRTQVDRYILFKAREPTIILIGI